MSPVAPELRAATAETRHYRELIGVVHKEILNLATDLEKSAALTHPSKKSEIEKRCAKNLRHLAAILAEEPI